MTERVTDPAIGHAILALYGMVVMGMTEGAALGRAMDPEVIKLGEEIPSAEELFRRYRNFSPFRVY